MGSEWQETNLGLLAVLKNGKGLKAAEYKDDGLYPVWGANGPIARTDHLLNNTPVVVIGRVGAYCGSVNWVNEPNWVTDNAIVAIPKEGNDLRFLYYLLKYIRPERTSIGSAQPLITQSGLKSLPCKVPTMEDDQRAIAHILGSLDDKIELNQQMNRTLEKMTEAVFKSWFIDFDPVRANAEGRDTGLPKEIGALFPDSFEDSELGDIPKGWEVRSLDEIADFLNGLACQKYPAVDGELSLPVIKIRELRQGITDNTDRATPNIPEEYLVNDGDVLFSWSGSLLVDVWTNGPGVLNQHLFKVTSARFPKWFFFSWVSRHLADFQHIAADKATTMGHIKRQHLTEAKVLVPKADLLKAMASHVAPLFEQSFQNNLETRGLGYSRDALLPMLFSGELDVSLLDLGDAE